MNNIFQGETFAEVYQQALETLVNNPDFICQPRNQIIKELLNVTLILTNPISNLFKNEVRSSPVKYIANELYLYFLGTNKAEEFGKHAKLWLDIQNSDGTVNSAYGYLIFKLKNCLWQGKRISQWEWAKNSLIKDKDTRQAILHYNSSDHQYDINKDFVCTLHNQFFIRDNKLYFNYYFRSQDCWRGTCSDIPFASSIHQLMRLELLEYYPELELGNLTYTCASFHLYEQHFEKAAKMLKHEFIADEIPALTMKPLIMYQIYSCKNSEDKFWDWVMEHRND